MAVGYFVQGSCIRSADAALAICQRLYPIAGWSGSTAQGRSCRSASLVPALDGSMTASISEWVCVGASCTSVSVPYTVQPCDTLDSYGALLALFAAFLAASATLFGVKKVYRLLTGTNSVSE